MLEGLDAIDWSTLSHAYGSAADVPATLRRLLSDDESERQEALSDLFGNIWHQGTVYEATAPAVPFLYELLACDDVEDRATIALLLTSIATGRGYFQVHADGGWGDLADWTKILRSRGRTLESEREREAAIVVAVRIAITNEFERLLPYLQDPNEEIRRAVAEACGEYPEQAHASRPALAAAEAVETDEDVRQTMREALTRLE